MKTQKLKASAGLLVFDICGTTHCVIYVDSILLGPCLRSLYPLMFSNYVVYGPEAVHSPNL